MYHDKKKPADQIGQHTLLIQASKQVIGFAEQIQKLKVNLSISGRAYSTFQNYSRLLAVMALHFKWRFSLQRDENFTSQPKYLVNCLIFSVFSKL